MRKQCLLWYSVNNFILEYFMKIFCTPKALDFFQNDQKGPSTQQRVINWIEAHEVSPGRPCMSGQVEHFRFRETEPQIGLDINWISFRINDAGRLIGAVVNVQGIGLCFFALDWAQNHDFQNTLVDKANLRQSYLKSITPFLKSLKQMTESSLVSQSFCKFRKA